MEILPELTTENFDALLIQCETKYLPVWAKLLPLGFVLIGTENKYNGWSKSEGQVLRINKLMKDIPRYFQKHSPLGKKYWNTSSSYGQKHQLADEIEKTEKNGYSTNGEFIFAMMLLDYEMKPLLRGDREKICPNATFNCSKRDLTKIVCECGLQYSRNSKQQHLRSKSHETIMSNKHINDTDTEFADYLDQAITRLKKGQEIV
jgi:hypothetical protein